MLFKQAEWIWFLKKQHSSVSADLVFLSVANTIFPKENYMYNAYSSNC